MVQYLGDYNADEPVFIPFNTFDSNDPQASVTITNLANTDIHIHRDDDTTQRNNAAGVTVNINFDSITGHHLVKIDTSDNTVDGFFQVGHDYFVRMEGTTVDTGTINAFIGHFSIENRYHPSAREPEYSVTNDWEQNHKALSGPSFLHYQDDTGYGVIHHWELDEVSDITYVSTDNIRHPKDALIDINLDHLMNKSVAGADVADDSALAKVVSSQNTADWDDYDNSAHSLQAIEEHINNIASTGAAFHVAAESYVLTTGTESANGIADTETRNETAHEHTDTAGTLDLYYQFDVGANGSAVEVEITALINGLNDSIIISVWDWVGSTWDVLRTLNGVAGDTYTSDIEALFPSHTGTGANDGKVRIRFNNTGLTSATLKVDQVFIAYAQDIDTLIGTPADTDVSTDIANVKADTAAILVDTNELQGDWTDAGRLDAILDAIVADTNELQGDWTNGGRLDLLLDRLITEVDTARAEPGQGAPAVNAKLGAKIDYLYKAWRNQSTQTATTYSLYNDAADTVDQKSTDSDNGTTATKGEIVSGP